MDSKHSLIFAAAVVLAAGCQASVGADVSTTAAQVGPVSRAKAIDAVAQAHCTHVYECNEFGGKHRFHDYDSCARAVRTETLAGPATCGEIDAARLSSCLQAIRTSTCGAPRSARFSACSDVALCR